MKKIVYILGAAFALVACSRTLPAGSGSDEIRFDIGIVPGTRASSTAFESGDRISLWAVEQPGGESIPLQLGGNFLNNEVLTLGSDGWTASRKLYWGSFPLDFYAVYPALSSLSSIESQPFTVQLDQNAPTGGGTLSGFEASDLLFASVAGVSRSDGPVKLSFRHLMSKCTVRIVKGEKFEGEIPDDIVVHIYNTANSGRLDIGKGSLVKDDFGVKNTITARKVSNTEFEAVLIPQHIELRTPLIEVSMGGIAYLLEYSLSFRPGYHHTIDLTLNTSPDQEKIEIGIDAGIDDWD